MTSDKLSMYKQKREGGTRENGAAVVEENETSVASGRSMQAIASGKGKKPKPFMANDGAVDADAV
jgi:bifunctional non-homologous end joining protein LigD